jgi:hypothetical protein
MDKFLHSQQRMKRLSTLLVGLLFVLCSNLHAQETEQGTRALLLKTGAGFNIGLADLHKRFPTFGILPFEVYYLNPKKITYGLSFNQFLGNRVTVDSLYGGIVGKSQIMFDREGFPGLIRYYMRGYSVQATVSKIFPINEKWKNSGIEVRLGVGFMEHKIRAKFDQGKLPQIEGEYALGYDKLSNGPMFSQAINFHYLNTETVSFFAGVNLGQAITKNRRSWDYGLMRQDNTVRKDLFFGVSGGILIPIIFKGSKGPGYFD